MLLPTSHMPEPLYLLITVNSTWKTHVHFKSSASTTDLGISLSKPTVQGSTAQDMALILASVSCRKPRSHPWCFSPLVPLVSPSPSPADFNFSSCLKTVCFSPLFTSAHVPLTMICCLNWGLCMDLLQPLLLPSSGSSLIITVIA